MRKIIFAVHPEDLKQEMLDFPAYLAKLTHSRLTAVFVGHSYKGEYRISDRQDDRSVAKGDEKEMLLVDTAKSVNAASRTFRNACEKKGIIGKIFAEKSIPLRKFVRQSRYTDILITSIDASSVDSQDKSARYLMVNSECPVFITSCQFKGVEEIIFAFDGSASAAFAIRQFTYLLPELNDKRATVIYSDETGTGEDVDGKEELMEWLQLHYDEAYFKTETCSVFNSFISAYRQNPAILGVMGAYGRSALSRFYQESSADEILKLISMPLFITHH